MNRLLKLSNCALALHGQPPLYETSAVAATARSKAPPRQQHSRTAAPETEELKDYSDCFHISVAWSLSEPSTSDQAVISNIDLGKLKELKVRFDCVKAKIGNNVTSIPLLDKELDDRGFVGA